ncbi:MAG: DUF1156 domain-containing protein [Roseomonas sp.]|nr:DUF1156 domain-containing protein [Roseomonas sp.]
MEPVIDAASSGGWRFEVRTGNLAKNDEKSLAEGTKAGRATFRCLLTGATIGGAYIDDEAQAGRMGARLMAIVVESSPQRVYLSPQTTQIEAAEGAADHVAKHGEDMDLPQQECRGTFASNAQGRRYCFKSFSDYFTPRQLVALTTFSDLLAEVREKVLMDTRPEAFARSTTSLAGSGSGPNAYADAVATYLAFAISKVINIGSSVASWMSDRGAFRETFARQGIPMTWDYAEANPFADAGGSIETAIDKGAMVIVDLPCLPGGRIENLAAQSNSFPVRPALFSTDPPYYDNISYSDLSDFFYVWLKRSVSGIWPDLFRRLTTPKDSELVAERYRHGSQESADRFFMRGMSDALVSIRKAATDDSPMAIYYAFKQSEAGEEGIASPGWASFLQAVVDAGIALDGTWPVRTESSGRLIGKGTNALASSIVLVCRKRTSDAGIATRAEFIRALKREMPDAIAAIRKAGVGPVDMQQSVIGPGMGIFTRFAKVLEDDDSAMTVRTALSLINRVWDEIENELSEAFDAPTQVALAWFATYGFDARPSGELITLANAKNIPLDTLFASGVFQDLRGKSGLVARENLPASWSPNTDKAPTIWECVQHTIRVLNAEDGGAEAAAALIAQMGPRAEDARALAYRLFEIATQKGWAAEALAYNALAQEWPRLADMAPEVIARKEMGAPQLTLL